MPVGTVEKVGTSRTGKPTVTIGGQLYSASKCDPPVATLRQGDSVEFDSASSQFNGSTVWFINSWKLVNGAQKYPTPGPVVQAPIGVPVNRLGAPVQDSERPAISNWIAAAIAAGKIDSCVDILPWVRAAKQALREDQEFQTDSDIP